MQYAHTETWLTFIKNWRFFEEKNSVNEIYSWSRGFVFRQKFMIWYKQSIFASKDVCINIYFDKKSRSHMGCWFYLYKGFIRYLNV